MNPLALLVAGCFFMEFLDGTIIVPALPHMAASLGTSTIDLNAAVSAYMLTVAVGILPSGWLAERYGTRRVFTSAILIFTLSSVLCGFATSASGFIAARVLQGVGGAMMVPVGRLAVLRTTEKKDLVRAIATLTWPGLSAPLIGPPLGGFIADYADWRWIFFVNLPLGLVGAVLSLRMMPSAVAPAPGTPARPAFDWAGFAFAAVLCLCVSTVLDRVADASSAGLWTGLLAVGAVVSGGLLYRHVRRHPHPILDFQPLAIRTFRLSVLDGTAMRILIASMPFLLPLMLQLGFGRSATEAGSMVLALFAGNIGIKPLTTPLMRRWGFRTVLTVNGVLQAASMLGCALLGPATPVAVVIAVFVVAGASRSVQFTALNTLVYADVPQRWMGMANTMFSVAFQLASGFGITLGAVALRLASTAYGTSGPTLPAFHATLMALAAMMLLVTLRALRLPDDAGALVSGRR